MVRSTLVSGGSFCGRLGPRKRSGPKLDDRPGDIFYRWSLFHRARELRANSINGSVTETVAPGAREVRGSFRAVEPVRFGRKWSHGARVVRSTLVSGGSFCGMLGPRKRSGPKLDDRPGDHFTDRVCFIEPARFGQTL